MPANAREERLVALLAEGASFAAAARAMGLDERTVRRKWSDPSFRARVETTQREVLERSMARMAGLAEMSVATLEDLLSSRSDSTRLGAVRLIQETLTRHRETVGFETQLRELEQLVAEVVNKP